METSDGVTLREVINREWKNNNPARRDGNVPVMTGDDFLISSGKTTIPLAGMETPCSTGKARNPLFAVEKQQSRSPGWKHLSKKS